MLVRLSCALLSERLTAPSPFEAIIFSQLFFLHLWLITRWIYVVGGAGRGAGGLDEVSILVVAQQGNMKDTWKLDGNE